MDITQHPAFDLSLKILLIEREKILIYNKTIALQPGFKIISTDGIDRFIKARKALKESGAVQMVLDL